MLDALGLGLFCVTGATKALDFHVGPAQAILLGAITGLGGGRLRDVLLGEIPTVLRQELYAIPALLGAAEMVVAQENGGNSAIYHALGAAVCVAVRIAPSERDRGGRA